jgi:DNA-binding SARP family transcriptional activator/Tfp pilus assembly protein PilF
VEFNILGRTRLSVNGGPVELGPANQRRLLALLLLRVGQPVPVDLIVDQLWPGRSREEVRGGLHSLVSRLRTVLKRAGVPCELTHAGNAYRLELDAQLIDYHRFRKQAEAGRAAAHVGDHALASRLLREAIGLWHGRPLEDLDTDWAAERRNQMEEGDRLPAQHALIDCSLAQAEYGDALALLGPLMDDQPSDETFVLQRMRALDGIGRPAEAMSLYSRFRRHIVTEFGMEPSQELREAYQAILNRRKLDNDRPPQAVGRTGPAPWQLPRVDTGITGRQGLLATLDDLVFGSDVGQPAPAIALHGMAGVGKTTLAAVWGWTRRDRFPDGCLFANLYGYTPDQHVSTDDAMARFLEALGIAPKYIPAVGSRRADMLNRELAGRRTLVVLDNVENPALARPVLSAISTCPVLVIGRTMPTGLVRDGVNSVLVPTLPEEDSMALLRTDINRVRAGDDQASIRALASLSGGLPFALKLIGQYAVNRPQVRLADIAHDLDSYNALLRATGEDDERDSLQGAFLMSFNALSPDAAALFRVLGLHPRPSFGRHAASALFGRDIGKTERQLKALTEVHLLEPEGSHRYRMHDLLHTYSANRAHRDLSIEQRHDAIVRLVDFYWRSASNAWDRLLPHSTPIPALPVKTNVVPMTFATSDEAFRWFTEERSNLIAVTRLAADYHLHEYAWRIPVTMSELFERTGYGDDFVDSAHVALASAKAAGDREAEVGILICLGSIDQARHDYRSALWHFQHALAIAEQYGHSEGLPVSLHNVGSANLKLGNVEDAIRLYQRALELDQQRGATDGVAWCLHRIGTAHRIAKRYDESLRYLHRALAIREEINDVRGQGATLTELGVLHGERGEPDVARDHCLRALDTYERSHDQVKAAKALTVLANVYCDIRSFPEAADCTHRALELCEITGDQRARARALQVHGRALDGLGDHDAAMAAWVDAVSILDDANDPEAKIVRTHITALTRRAHDGTAGDQDTELER